MSVNKAGYTQIFSSHENGLAHNVYIPESQKASWMAIKAGQEGGHDTGAWQAQLDELNKLRDVLNDAATTDSIRAETIVAIDKVVKQVAV